LIGGEFLRLLGSTSNVCTTTICADFLVELRGFEPLTTAEQAHARGDSAAASKG
jgi:hypothetical protein